MSTDGTLIGLPLRPQGSFNWVYLVELITSGILALFFLFYFNRVFATLISYAIRLYSWHRLRIYIHIDALQISPLAGRLFFKGLRYHGENQTIIIHSGYVTWRYWLRKVKECEILTTNLDRTHVDDSSLAGTATTATTDSISAEEKGGAHLAKKLPCRINVRLSGLEAFLYNRSPIYDDLIKGVHKHKQKDGAGAEGSEWSGYDPHIEKSGIRARNTTSSSDSQLHSGSTSVTAGDLLSSPSDIKQVSSGSQQDEERNTGQDDGTPKPSSSPALPLFLRLLPVHVKCTKGAMVLGNDHLKNVITAKFDCASGEFDAANCGPLDIFKILMNFDIDKPVIQMKSNMDYTKSQMAEAADIKNMDPDETLQSDASNGRSRGLSKLLSSRYWRRAQFASIRRQNDSVETVAKNTHVSAYHEHLFEHPPLPPGHNKWLGLTRYLDETQRDEHDEWDAVEYARASTLADCKRVGFRFYWDIPGPVPHAQEQNSAQSERKDINGSKPPEYGLDLAVHGGFLNYGPWADRQRVGIQQIFFPMPYVDTVPVQRLRPGDPRVSTVFKLFLSIEEETVLRIPFREPSKDHKWKGRASNVTGGTNPSAAKDESDTKSQRRRFKHSRRNKGTTGLDVRPFAWFDIRVNANTTVSYAMAMVASDSGYKNILNADVKDLKILSSLNHGILWDSQRVTLDCDLSNPLGWSTLRKWHFDIGIFRLDLFLLRDHTFQLMDLINDWTSGSLTDYFTFVPYRYLLDVHFHDFKLFLNTNDANIINNHADLEDNNFMILYGRALDAQLVIPLDVYNPNRNNITFNVDSNMLGLEMSSPPKNTLSSLLVDKDVAQLANIHLEGAYTYCSEVAPGLTESLFLDITGTDFTIHFFGFVARQLVRIKENYFGEDLHFRTLEEYHDLLHSVKDPYHKYQPDVSVVHSNDLDVILNITAHNPTIILPAGLYKSEEHVRLKVETADVDLRVSNYFLELMVNSTPLELGHCAFDQKNPPTLESSATEIFIESLQVYGHRFFGLPPDEPAYVSNWDIDAGKIVGEFSSTFIRKLVAAGKALMVTMLDHENTMPLDHIADVHDMTFVRFQCPLIRLWFHAETEAFLFRTNGVFGNFNDCAGLAFSQRLNLSVPGLTLACVDRKAAVRKQRDDESIVKTYAAVDTSINMVMVQRVPHFLESRRLQQNHLTAQDQRTKRATFLVASNSPVSGSPTKENSSTNSEPTLPLPNLPEPLTSSVKGFENNPQSPHVNGELSSKRARNLHRRNLAPSDSYRSDDRGKVELSSSFVTPYFPLDGFDPDLSGLPPVALEQQQMPTQAAADPSFSDVYRASDYGGVHTSLIVTADTGIRVHCTPQAIYAMIRLLRLLGPKAPRELLDYYHVSVLTKVLAIINKVPGKLSLLDLNVRVPCIQVQFVKEFHVDSDPDHRVDMDHYGITIDEVTCLTRVRDKVTEEVSPHKAIALHLTAKALTLDIQEVSKASGANEVAFKATVDDVLVWLAEDQSTLVHVFWKDLQAELVSQKIDFLNGLILRTAKLAESIKGEVETIMPEIQRRLWIFIYRLNMLSDNSISPPFLNRPANAIRVAKEHLRTTASWQILSQLQYNLQQLSKEEYQQLARECAEDFIDCPSDIAPSVLAQMDQLRSWDSRPLQDTVVLQFLRDPNESPETVLSIPAKPLGLVVRCVGILVTIDPGEVQNDLIVNGVALNVSVRPPVQPSGLMLGESHDHEVLTEIQASLSSFSVGLKWNICPLVDTLLSLFNRDDSLSSTNSATTVDKGAASVRKAPERIQLVFTIDSVSLSLETINLKLQTQASDVRIALTGTDWASRDGSITANALINATQASSDLSSRCRSLATARLQSASLWVSYESQIQAHVAQDALKLAADSAEFALEIQEEVQGLVEICSFIVSDEVSYIHRLVQTHQDTTLTSIPAPATMDRTTKIDVALFLNLYTIDIRILDGLSYHTTGNVIRLSLSPRDAHDLKVKLDYDLKSQEHQFYNADDVFSVFRMPAMNGTMTVARHKSSLSVTALGTVEKVKLEGSAVYRLLSIFTSPRVSSAINAVRNDVLVVVDKVKTLIPSSTDVRSDHAISVASSDIRYDFRLAFAGLSLSADAPPSTTSGTVASNLIFELGRVYLRGSNATSTDGSVLPLPNILASLSRSAITVRYIDGEHAQDCGQVAYQAVLIIDTTKKEAGPNQVHVQLEINGPEILMSADTAPVMINILTHFQSRLSKLDLLTDHLYSRRLIRIDTVENIPSPRLEDESLEASADNIFTPMNLDLSLTIHVQTLQIGWLVGDSIHDPVYRHPEDLVLSIKKIHLSSRSGKDARLIIEETLLQITPYSQVIGPRSPNSALLPDMNFAVAHRRTKSDRQLVFQAAGKALDLQIDPQIVLPASEIGKSISMSIRAARKAATSLSLGSAATSDKRKPLFGKRKLTSLLISADFAGAVVRLQARKTEDQRRPTLNALHLNRPSQYGNFGQFSNDGSAVSADLRSPGIATKIQYQDIGDTDPALDVEIRVSGSNNTLHPSVVPIIVQISESVKQAVQDSTESDQESLVEVKPATKLIDEETIVAADPSKIIGKMKLNIGLRICKQEFTLSCQPIAKVVATARLNDIYITVNNVESTEKGNFFAISATLTGLNASLQHVYSRDATFSFGIESIVLSLMNSKHHGGTSGISAILKINPTQTTINVKQLQDILLFRDIWAPEEIRNGALTEPTTTDPQEYFVNRYRQVAASTPFHWNATVLIASLCVQLDLGQAIGKTTARVQNVWASSKKASTTHQDLCVGIDDAAIESTGRMGGLVELQKLKLRTSISWPPEDKEKHKTPLIQISVGFDSLRTKAAFDYVPFAIVHITMFEFIMYNVRDPHRLAGDRLVAILDGDTVSAYCVATSAAIGLAMFQAFERLFQEQDAAYEQASSAIERFHGRKMSMVTAPSRRRVDESEKTRDAYTKRPISLHTDVVVNLGAIDFGAFPNSLFDRQILKVDTADIQARFAVALEDKKIHSGLGLTLGQLRVSLAATSRPSVIRPLAEITVEEIVTNANSARGGVILRVPKVLAAMQTWQADDGNTIDYIFRSSFEGKIDVGWNYSRISYIRGMWATHSRALAARLGKPLPEPAVKITGVPEPHMGDKPDESISNPSDENRKITAVVNLPQSRYVYRALEPPIIVTPQLRDMGEATPPLEWIGLQREKLPNVTHQIIIVALLEIAREVEDAYSRILGSA